MKEEVAKAWSAALRSGKYEQGFDRLRKNDCYCAIGVLCDILDPEGWKKSFGSWLHNGNETSLVPDLARKIEVAAHAISIKNSWPDIDGRPVVELNDKQRLSFLEIADLIDQHWQSI